MALRPCMICGNLTSRSRCSRCQPPKPPAVARGYGSAHRAERARWKPIMETSGGYCAEIICVKPHRYIAPGEPWDLAHTPDRTAYLGVSHAACNRSAGARNSNRQRRGR